VNRPIPDLADTRELSLALGIPADELVRRRRSGLGPRAVKIGRDWFYLRNFVLCWLAEIAVSDAADFAVSQMTGSS
jgi:hypothetical protein